MTDSQLNLRLHSGHRLYIERHGAYFIDPMQRLTPRQTNKLLDDGNLKEIGNIHQGLVYVLNQPCTTKAD